MHVVANTSPLLNLAVTEQADILQKLCGRVTAPEAVRSEIDLLSQRNPRFSSVSVGSTGSKQGIPPFPPFTVGGIALTA